MQWIAVYVSPYFAVGVFVTSSGCKRRYPMRIQFPDAVIFSVTKIEVILVVVRTNSFTVFLVFYEYTELWFVKPALPPVPSLKLLSFMFPAMMLGLPNVFATGS